MFSVRLLKMNKLVVCTVCVLCFCCSPLTGNELGKSADTRSIKQRVEGRQYPSIFQAWSPADNLKDEDKNRTLARHDLVWHSPGAFGLVWNNGYRGLADGFDPQSIVRARAHRRDLLALNPNIILIAEIRYRDAHRRYLPEGHKWWLRSRDGRIVAGWSEGKFLCLDFHNAEYRQHVAKQAKAVVETGVVDGILLDWWSDDEDRLSLVREVRAAAGKDVLIIANANDRKTPRTAPYINGYFMECYRSRTVEDWNRMADTLSWAEANLRNPRVNCLESWYHKSRNDHHLMRAVTTLSLTHSDGYCLFSDPNPLPTGDHRHNWYSFWDTRLGRPVANGEESSDGTTRREFDHGTAVYNPMGNRTVTVTFAASRTSVATGLTSRKHELASPDGDIYISERFGMGVPPNKETPKASRTER